MRMCVSVPRRCPTVAELVTLPPSHTSNSSAPLAMRGALLLPVVSARYCPRQASRLVAKQSKTGDLRFVDAQRGTVVFRAHRDDQGVTRLVHARHGDVARIHQQRTARMSTFLVQTPEQAPDQDDDQVEAKDHLFELRGVASETNSVLVARFRDIDTNELCRLMMVGDRKHTGCSIWLTRGEGANKQLQRIARMQLTTTKKDKKNGPIDQEQDSLDDLWRGVVEIAPGVDQTLILLAYLAFRDTKLSAAAAAASAATE